MFLTTVVMENQYSRPSKLGKVHSYVRSKIFGIFSCDSCQQTFQREIGKMERKRLSNNYYHVCQNCDWKRFAQQKGVERRKVWNMSVDSDINIDKI